MSKFKFAPADDRYELTKVALGESDADLAIVNGSLVNVYTGELLIGDCILIKGDKIAYTGKYLKKGIVPATRIIEATGKVIIPGLVAGHTHLDYICSTSEIVRCSIRTGTTSIITETAEAAFKLGYRGVLEYLKSIRNQPVKFWFTLPPMGTISPAASEHLLTLDETRRLLRRDDCVGTGEVYWNKANAGEKRQLEIIAATIQAGKKVEGHSAGAAANKLQAYTALGITSDHEPITAEETLERLRLGLSVMAREGEVRQDLEAISQLKDRKIDFRRLAVSTDGIGPWELLGRGFMDYLVQHAIDLGFPPIQAIQMGTLNVAEHFNLQDIIGGIAPGKYADIVIIPEIDTIKPETVISNGEIVLLKGESQVQPQPYRYPSFAYQAIRLEKNFKAADFAVPVNTSRTTARVRVIDQLTNVLTRESILDLPVAEGHIRMDAAKDIIKVAAVEYQHTHGQTFTGFIRGLGLKKGAVSTSTCWDSTNLTVAGANEDDMALAVNRIQELHGGTVVCLNGKVAAEAAFPIGGVISDDPLEVLADKLTGIQRRAEEMGCVSPDIRTTLSVLLTPAIPYLRICESGLFNIRLNSPVDLIVNGE